MQVLNYLKNKYSGEQGMDLKGCKFKQNFACKFSNLGYNRCNTMNGTFRCFALREPAEGASRWENGGIPSRSGRR